MEYNYNRKVSGAVKTRERIVVLKKLTRSEGDTLEVKKMKENAENKIKQFEELLRSVLISDDNTDEQNLMSIDAITDCVLETIPANMYRFRSCNKYSLQSLKDDTIWGTLANSFNDAMECVPAYDLDLVNEQLSKYLSMENAQKQLDCLKNGSIPDVISKSFGGEFLQQISNLVGDEASMRLFQQQYPAFKSMLFGTLQEDLDVNLDEFFSQVFEFRERLHIACFSENLESPLMWGHYADSYKGFVLEYDMRENIAKCTESCKAAEKCMNFHLNHFFAPVMYSQKRYDASPFLMSLLEERIAKRFQIPIATIYERDKFRIPKIILTKSNDWEYEREWRMFKTSDGGSQPTYKCIAEHIPPKAVYIGHRMSPWYQRRIINLCKGKGIPCYRMLNAYTTTEFKLIADTYTDLTKEC